MTTPKQQIKKLDLIYKSKLPLDIEKRNKAFTRLQKKNKKKEIALDALKMLFLQAYLPSEAAYFESTLIDDEYFDEIDSTDLQKQLCKISKTKFCEVCARGAILTSRIRIGNTIGKPEYTDINSVLSGKITTEKENIFSTIELEEMESMYEYGYNPYYHNTYDCLANILLNIINNGMYVYNSVNYLKTFNELKPKSHFSEIILFVKIYYYFGMFVWSLLMLLIVASILFCFYTFL